MNNGLEVGVLVNNDGLLKKGCYILFYLEIIVYMMKLTYTINFIVNEVILFTCHSKQRLSELVKLLALINLVKLLNIKVGIMYLFRNSIECDEINLSLLF